MTEKDATLSPPPGSTPSEMFPVLTAAQQARVLAHGQRRTVEENEIVVELNEQVTKVFVVVGGRLHALKVSNNQEQVVALCNPGMFTGELTVLTGRRGLVRIRDDAGVEKAFFSGTLIESNFIYGIGHGDAASVFPRNPRLSFEEAGPLGLTQME